MADMDLQAILNALLPIMENGKPCEGGARVDLTLGEYLAATNSIAMLQLADLVNYRKAQAAYPWLLKAVKLILSIADNPFANPEDRILLSSKTRAQLDSALKFAEND